jgi:hypothetical protein
MARWICVTSLLIAGCNFSPANPCDADSDCVGGARCDRSVGVCVAPPDAGPGDAGVDAGPGCEAITCAAHQECSASTCVPRYSAASLEKPTAGTSTDGGAVPVVARLTLAPGRSSNPPDALELVTTAPGGSETVSVLTHAAGDEFSGTWTPGALDGPYQLRARHAEAGVISEAVTVEVDRTAPTFQLQVPIPVRPASDAGTEYGDPEPGYQAAHRRDETVILGVSTADPHLRTDSVMMTVAGLASDGGAGVSHVYPVGSWTLCDAGWCGHADVDLSKPELNAPRGLLAIEITGADNAGNAGRGEGEIAVTRWKWAFNPNAGSIVATPAIGKSGVIYLGTTGGAVAAVAAEGQVLWSVDAGTVVGAPAVGRTPGGEDRIYFAATSGSNGAVRQLAADGQLVASCPFSGEARASIALGHSNAGAMNVETAVGLIVGAGEVALVGLRPDVAVAQCLSPVFSVPEPDVETGIATDGASYYYGDVNGAVQSYELVTNGWAAKVGWPVNTNLFVRALTIVGTDVVGAGAEGPAKGGAFRIPSSGGSVTWRYPAAVSSSRAWSPSVGPNKQVAYGGTPAALTFVTLGAATATDVATAGAVKGAPTWGEGGWVYTASSDGAFEVWAPGTPRQWAVTGLGSLDAAVALDCRRTVSGAKLPGAGTAYVASKQGKLYAFIVDSAGIDVSAPWPKHGHDPRNTANATTDLQEFGCPP